MPILTTNGHSYFQTSPFQYGRVAAVDVFMDSMGTDSSSAHSASTDGQVSGYHRKGVKGSDHNRTDCYSPTQDLSSVARGLCRWEKNPARTPPSSHPNRRFLRNVATRCWTPRCQESCPTDEGVPS